MEDAGLRRADEMVDGFVDVYSRLAQRICHALETEIKSSAYDFRLLAVLVEYGVVFFARRTRVRVHYIYIYASVRGAGQHAAACYIH